MKILSKANILEAQDLPRVLVEVPEWGGAVYVRGLTGSERDAWEAAIVGDGKRQNLANIRANLVGKCLVDENGDRMFADSELVALGRKSAAALDRLFDRVRELSGLTAADVERIEEQLEANPTDGPSSG